MNKKIILTIILISILFTFITYKLYSKTEELSTKIYLIQAGAYKDHNNLSEATKQFENYIIKKEGELYKIYIGVTKDEEVYNKLSKIYLDGKENFKKVVKITNEEYSTNLDTYDNIIKNTDDKRNINIVVKSSLKELEKLLESKKL